jgi:isoquinoline 1-oxidoreductase beta subunit
MIPIIVNGKRHQVDVDSDTPLLWVLRENLSLTGTKFGCGIAQCGACTVHLDGQPIRSCITQIGSVKGKKITTIEGLSPDGNHPLQKAWIAEEVPQCGYCQSGQIMSAAAMLAAKPRPTNADIDTAMSGNICRCGTYQRIRRAIHRAAGTLAREVRNERHRQFEPAFFQSRHHQGGGLLLGFHVPAQAGAIAATVRSEQATLNSWVRIARDGTVTVIVGQSEMGQGIMTAIPMIIADELEAEWSKVRIEQAPADPAFGDPGRGGEQSTNGSRSIRNMFTLWRRAGAAAREMLVVAAAKEWGVPLEECVAEQSVVTHRPSGRKLTYGELADKAAALPVPKEPKLKSPEQFRFIGKAVARLDTPEKVTGRGIYGIDVKVPGMLIATVQRCPVFGGKVASYDATKAKTVKGVRQVVQISSGVAVVADSYWAAKKGREALNITWDEGPNAQLSSAEITRIYAETAKQPGPAARKEGDAVNALGGAAKTIDAVYEVPFLAHATMEPMNCTAHVRKDSCDVWVGTQNQTGTQRTAMRITGFPREAINVNTMLLAAASDSANRICRRCRRDIEGGRSSHQSHLVEGR